MNFPTELLVTSTRSTPTVSENTESTAPAGTPGVAVGREADVLGAVVGGLFAGLAVL